jgi:hypothetical protein
MAGAKRRRRAGQAVCTPSSGRVCGTSPAGAGRGPPVHRRCGIEASLSSLLDAAAQPGRARGRCSSDSPHTRTAPVGSQWRSVQTAPQCGESGTAGGRCRAQGTGSRSPGGRHQLSLAPRPARECLACPEPPETSCLRHDAARPQSPPGLGASMFPQASAQHPDAMGHLKRAPPPWWCALVPLRRPHPPKAGHPSVCAAFPTHPSSPPCCFRGHQHSVSCCPVFPFLLHPRLRHSAAAPEEGRNKGGSPPPTDLSPAPPWHTTSLHGLHRHSRPRTRYALETPSPRRATSIRASPIHKLPAFPPAPWPPRTVITPSPPSPPRPPITLPQPSSPSLQSTSHSSRRRL